MKNLSIAVASIAILASSNTALATEANPFAGFRIDAQIGVDAVSTTEINRQSDETQTSTDKDAALPTVSYGVGVGYDVGLTDKIIVGIESNLTFTDASDSGFEGFIANDIHGDNMKLGREFDLAARAGYVVNPSVLAYVKAGYAVARMRFDVEKTIDAGDDYDDLGRQNYSRGGLRLGAGVEAKLTKRVYSKFEYRYTDYNDWNTFQDVSADGYTDNATFKVDRHQVVAAIGYRF